MRSFAKAFLVVSLMTATTMAWCADRYEIDKVHSTIGFKVRHLGLSSVTGKFADFSGTIMYDEKDVTNSTASVTIKTASIDTGSEKRDEHLRSADFFDVAKYPEITFVSKSVSKKGEDLVLAGALTMHGVTRDVSIPFTIGGKATDPTGVVRAGAEGATTLNRLDYKIGDNKMLNSSTMLIGNEIKVELLVEAVKK
jgi:polyisoprenoid-binding protein YceI